ncbi:MAG: winged helix-turn-helix domain-containing protein [Planctomycetota bacterium]|jgi:DNA-binding MarR family transcriptional regulator
MENPLEALFGNRTAAMFMLYLFHYQEAYARGAARDLGIAVSAVQRQLDKFETAGLLVSRMIGNTRVYTFNPRQPATAKLKELIRVFYEAMTLKERERLFATRRRPRRKGKPIVGQET